MTILFIDHPLSYQGPLLDHLSEKYGKIFATEKISEAVDYFRENKYDIPLIITETILPYDPETDQHYIDHKEIGYSAQDGRGIAAGIGLIKLFQEEAPKTGIIPTILSTTQNCYEIYKEHPHLYHSLHENKLIMLEKIYHISRLHNAIDQFLPQNNF